MLHDFRNVVDLVDLAGGGLGLTGPTPRTNGAELLASWGMRRSEQATTLRHSQAAG